jgi:hypothetical protein
MEIKPLHTKVDKTIQTLHGTIVLEDPAGFPRADCNLYCISAEGRLVWKAEKPEPSTLYSRVKLNENGASISTYTLGSHACELDLGTGKILSKTSIQ